MFMELTRFMCSGDLLMKREVKLVKCERCGSVNTIPIIYGYPSRDTMDAFLAASRRGEIRMGGCCVSEGMPTYHCKDCNRDSGSLVLHEGPLKSHGEDQRDIN